MKKITTLLLLVLLLLILSTAACGGDGDSDNSRSDSGISLSTPIPNNLEATMAAADATATYGADQFYLQLTAMAEDSE